MAEILPGHVAKVASRRVNKKSIFDIALHSAMADLEYGDSFWINQIPDLRQASLQICLHLVFSLICFLNVSLFQFFKFTFESDIKQVKGKASIFMGYNVQRGPLEYNRWPPALMMHLWSTRWSVVCHKHFKDMIAPYAAEIVLRESNSLISDKTLQISLKKVTIESILNILKPETLAVTYQDKAPFTFQILHTFAASPNPYRKKKTKKGDLNTTSAPQEPARFIHDLDGDSDDEMADHGIVIGEDSNWENQYPGFSRNPLLVSVFFFSECLSYFCV